MDFTNLISRLNAIGSLQGSVTEAQSAAQKAAFAKMIATKNGDKAKKPDADKDEEQVDEALNVRKLGDTMGVDVQQLRMAVNRASAGRQTRNDIMLLSDTFVKLLNNPDDTVIQTVANLIKSGNTAPAPKANMKQEGNEFSGALDAAREAGEEEFEVGGKTYKVNEDCGDVEMSPLSSMGQMSSSPEHEHNERYTLTITRGDKNLNVTTDNPDELLSIMKLAGISGSTEVVQQAPEQEVEESGYENTPAQTNEREPKAYGDIRDWGMPGTGRGQPGSALNKPSGQGDNPLGEQAMMESYKKFKAGK